MENFKLLMSKGSFIKKINNKISNFKSTWYILLLRQKENKFIVIPRILLIKAPNFTYLKIIVTDESLNEVNIKIIHQVSGCS